MVLGPAEGRAPRTVPERLSELAPPWQLEPLHEAMKSSQLEREGDTGTRPHSLSSEAGDDQAHIDALYEPGWVLYPWQPPAKRQEKPPRGAGVSTFARRLMALERSRMRRSTGASSSDRRPRTPSRVF